jgi:formylglycine-generating enzyme required for sulfatase activity/serine/threonine protein kinase
MARSGDKIGPYTLVRKLGRGGFGEVWLAEKKTRITTTEFALKLALEENPDIDAIQQEAELWKQASGHPNVLPIIEADIYDEYIVIVSEFARGGSLESWLKTHQGAAPSIDVAVEMISGILSGLAHLHSLHIIHRDLKPANILLQGDRPRLADFGLARVLKSSQFSQTVAGTPEYMAPEAFLNERTEQADLWAVGVMLYQMLTGRLPFPLDERMSPWQKMAAITTLDVTPPLPSVPEPLREVIIKSLQKKPEQRYKSAGEMQAAIIEAIEFLKYKTKEDTIRYPTRSDVPLEETKPSLFDASPVRLTETLGEDAVLDSAPMPRMVPTESTPPSHSDLKPVETEPALAVATESHVLEQTEVLKPKRAATARRRGIVGVIVLAIGLMIGAIWVLVSKSSSPATVNQQTTSGGIESAKPSGGLSTGPLPLRGFEFDTVTVDGRGRVTERRKGQGQYFVEDINGVALEMVEIPGGTFMMGTSDGEAQKVVAEYDRHWSYKTFANQWVSRQRPQHRVSVPTFYMGKYEVTQAQWRAVASLPKVNRDLETDPSKFKGDNLPVENVSWGDAVEFCERLSRATGRQYRLPTEAEWEYACRAGSASQFAFGDTITPELVNYNGNSPYGTAPKGTDRQHTIPVGSLGIANAFGLFDMHGNVSEWCLDRLHENYDGAPNDGSAWEGGDMEYRMLRGGSWLSFGSTSRAADRNAYRQDDKSGYHGFRVVLDVRTR